MSVKKVNKTTGATTKVAGLVNSEKVNTMYGAFPSDASASNKLVSDSTANEKISDAIANKADKVSSATNGNFAGLDVNGNLTDSGKKPSDFQTALTFDNAPTENSNNPVKSGGVYSANQNIYEVMGQNSAKNFIPFDLDKIKAKNTTGTWNGNVYSLNGIDFTFNSDGTVDASGTATETTSMHYYDPVGLPPFGGDRILRLTGCPSGGSNTTYKVMAYRANAVDGSTGTAEDYGDGISLKWLNDGSGVKAFVSISVYTGAGTIDITFKPMLRLSTDTDNTFAPYAKTNQELTAENEALTNQANDMVNVLGAKNLLPFNLADIIANNTAGTWNGKTFTQTGSTLKITLNDDGSITVDGTANSSATATLFLYGKSSLAEENDFKGMILGGCPSGGTTKGYSLVAQGFDTSATSSGTNYNDLGSGVTIGDKDYLRVYVRVQAGVTVNNLTFYPMIRLASITDDTYEPYAKTNRELTGYADSMEVNGAVNMLPYPYKRGDEVINGITSVVDSDGVITLNGTATAATSFIMFERAENKFALPKGSYKAIVKTVSGTYTGTLSHILRATESGSGIVKVDKSLGEAGVFSISTDTYIGYQINIPSGAVLTNLKLAPMITVSSYNGDYVPYAMSNSELTEVVSGTVLQNGLYMSITYTPTNDESWQSRLYHLYEELQAFQNTLEDNERFTITNLNLGTTALWANHANAFYRKSSIIGDDFSAVFSGTTQMIIRSVRIEPNEANNRFSKTVITYSNNAVECTDESNAVGTNPVSLRIVKYKYNA